MTNGDPHNRKRTLQRLKSKVKTSEEISSRDKNILVNGTEDFPSFLSYMQNQDHSISRINRYLRTWHRICEHVDWNIEEGDTTKLTELVGDLNTGQLSKRNNEKFSEATRREIKKGIRKMYTDYMEKYAANLEVRDSFEGDEIINFTLTITRKFTDPDRLPTPKTVKSLIENMDRTRDKAYTLLLWSTGGRHSEILGLKWQDISFSNSVGKVTFRDTKTGGDHTVPMGEAYPFMRRLFEEDSRSNEGDTYVFRSTQSDEQFSASGAANIILNNAPEDIPDKIKLNPHAFRKGRTSYWARQEKGEAWICQHMNWAQGSAVVRHYCRIAQEDVEQGVAEHLGLQEKQAKSKDESKILTPSECHNCKEINTFQADICRSCGEALRTSELITEWEIEEKTNMFMEEIITSETSFDPKQINKKAEEFVKEEFNL